MNQPLKRIRSKTEKGAYFRRVDRLIINCADKPLDTQINKENSVRYYGQSI
jgi:hypothetical protein